MRPRKRLLIMLSPGRSFSTVISAMLGLHPEIHALPETCLFARETLTEYMDARGTALFDVGLRRAIERIVAEDGQGPPAGERWLGERMHLSTRAVFDDLVAPLTESVIVDKSPIYTSDDAHMRRIERLFGEDALYVHLTRHPADYAASLLETFEAWKRSVLPAVFEASIRERESLFYGLVGEDDPAPDPYGVWLRRNSSITAFLSAIDPDRRIVMQAEGFLSEPEASLRRLLAFLGLSVTAAEMVEMLHPERWQYAKLTSRIRGGGDRKFFDKPELQPNARRLIVGAALEAERTWPASVRKLAAQFGYL